MGRIFIVHEPVPKDRNSDGSHKLPMEFNSKLDAEKYIMDKVNEFAMDFTVSEEKARTYSATLDFEGNKITIEEK